MDHIAKAVETGTTPCVAEAQVKDNQTLKRMVIKLNRELLTERKQSAIDREALRLLRAANAQLVVAAFKAEDARQEADAARTRQTVFLSMLAHELRNPMASIAVANSVIASLNLGHIRLDKMVAIVKRQCDHLVRLVDDLLDASRIATGKLSLHTRQLDLHDVIDSAVETAQATLSSRQQRAVLALPATPLAIDGDPVRLAQLFANLLVNASKFSPPFGVITLGATRQGSMVSVAVRDYGKGIAAHDQGAIFDLFEQGAEERAHAWSGGLGIGLTLVRSIAAMHRGSVRVISAGPGCGSEFIVLLPLCN